MLCYLYSKELRKREGKPAFFVCKWVGVIGDDTAKKSKETEINGQTRKVISLQAVKARQINLTKCIFPTTDEKVKEWNKVLIPLYEIKTDEDTGEITEKEVETDINEVAWLNLCYKSVLISSISEDIKRIQYTKANGEIAKTDSINIIGFADDAGEWAEDLSVEETAKNNLFNGLASGAYVVIDED